MKALISLSLIVLALAGCAGKTAYRDSCGSQLDAAWKELDLAKAQSELSVMAAQIAALQKYRKKR